MNSKQLFYAVGKTLALPFAVYTVPFGGDQRVGSPLSEVGLLAAFQMETESTSRDLRYEYKRLEKLLHVLRVDLKTPLDGRISGGQYMTD